MRIRCVKTEKNSWPFLCYFKKISYTNGATSLASQSPTKYFSKIFRFANSNRNLCPFHPDVYLHTYSIYSKGCFLSYSIFPSLFVSPGKKAKLLAASRACYAAQSTRTTTTILLIAVASLSAGAVLLSPGR